MHTISSLITGMMAVAYSLLLPSFFCQVRKKSNQNFNYTRRISPKRITRGGAHLRGVAHEQHSYEETSRRWRAVGDTESI